MVKNFFIIFLLLILTTHIPSVQNLIYGKAAQLNIEILAEHAAKMQNNPEGLYQNVSYIREKILKVYFYKLSQIMKDFFDNIFTGTLFKPATAQSAASLSKDQLKNQLSINTQRFQKKAVSTLSPLESFLLGITYNSSLSKSRKYFESSAKNHNYLAKFYLEKNIYKNSASKKQKSKAVAELTDLCKKNFIPACQFTKNFVDSNSTGTAENNQNNFQQKEAVDSLLFDIQDNLRMLNQ